MTPELLQIHLDRFKQHCRVPFDWDAYPTIDPADPGENEPKETGLAVRVRAEGFRRFDPRSREWLAHPGGEWFFVVDEDRVLHARFPLRSGEPHQEPLLRIERTDEMAGHIALHVAGALDPKDPVARVDPIEELWVPFPKYPDDRASLFENMPHVRFENVRKLFCHHIEADAPWLFDRWNPNLEALRTRARQVAWSPATPPDERNDAETALAAIDEVESRGLPLADACLRRAAELPEEAFKRDCHAIHGVFLPVHLRGEDADLSNFAYPVLAALHPAVHAPFCAKNVCPMANLVLLNSIRARILPESPERPANKPAEWPPIHDQALAAFEIGVFEHLVHQNLALFGNHVLHEKYARTPARRDFLHNVYLQTTRMFDHPEKPEDNA